MSFLPDICDPSIIPSVPDVIRCLRVAPRRKAVGEDLVGGDVWNMFASILGPMLHALIVKSIVTVHVPIVWKGGMLVELWKRKGPQSSVASYRDVLIQDHPAKSFGSLLRPALRRIVGAAVRPTQYGSGLNAGSTEVAHMSLRCIIDLIRLRRTSGAIIFIDVIAAFASFRRKLVLSSPVSDEQWLRLLVSFGFTRDDAAAVVEDACSPTLWANNGGSAHLHAALSELYRDTWFATEGLDSAVTFDTGSMAGSGPADLIFTFAMTKILNTLHADLRAVGLVPSAASSDVQSFFGIRNMPAGDTIEHLEISFVDDVAIPVIAAAADLVASIRKTIEISVAVFARYGLQLNFSPGKSEAVIHWGGPGAAEAKRNLVVTLRNSILCQDPSGADFTLLVSRAYKCLGTRTSFAASISDEVKGRVGLLRSDMRTYKHRLLANPVVPIDRKALLVEALMFSRGLYQASTWPVVDGAAYRHLHAAVMGVYRSMCNDYWTRHSPPRMTDHEVLEAVGCPGVGALLRKSRLMAFVRFFTRVDYNLLHLLHTAAPARSSWISAVRSDLSWLARSAPELGLLPDSHLSRWVQLVQSGKGSFCSALRRATSLYGRDCVPSRASRTLMQAGERFSCSLCSAVFASKPALATHRARKHWELSEVRKYITSTRCDVCSLECHTRYHIIAHVAFKSPICLHNYRLRNTIVPDWQIQQLDQIERERIKECRARSMCYRRQPVAAYRPGMPARPVLRPDGAWLPGDPSHPLGPGRSLLRHIS